MSHTDGASEVVWRWRTTGIIDSSYRSFQYARTYANICKKVTALCLSLQLRFACSSWPEFDEQFARLYEPSIVQPPFFLGIGKFNLPSRSVYKAVQFRLSLIGRTGYNTYLESEQHCRDKFVDFEKADVLADACA